MRTKLRCLLLALILLPGCRSFKEVLFPADARSTEPGIYQTTEKRRQLEIEEDAYNMGMREKRKGS